MARLLLVDDDISEISAVKRVLSRSGLAPLLATNAPDALASVGQARPDLLLLGATCQGGEALEAIRQLDDDEATRGIPLIILGESPNAPERAVQLPRPVDPAALAEQVKQFLSAPPDGRPFERRLSAPELPASLDRRSGPSDPTLARKAAAEALLARALELRGRRLAAATDRPATAAPPAASEAAAGLDALFELEPPAGVPGPPAPIAETPFDLPGAPPPAPASGTPAAPPVSTPPIPFQLEEPGRERANAEALAARQAMEARQALEAQLALEAQQAFQARQALEEELRQVRELLVAERRKHDEELHTVLERATARERAALEQQASAAEAAASRAVAEAEARFGSALEQLRDGAISESERQAAAMVTLPYEPVDRPGLAEPEFTEAPRPFFADVPPPDPVQETARRRALSRRVPPDAPAEPGALADAAWARPALEAPPAELRGGNLDDLPMPRLLAVAWGARASGRLDVVGDATRALWFEDGAVVGAASNAAGERLDEVALRLGLLTRDQHRQVAGAVTGLATRRAAVLLIDRGYLKPGELTGLVRARTEEVVFGVFAESHARFRWIADPVRADERIALDRTPLALAVEGVRRRWLAPRTEAILGGPATLVAPAHGGPAAEELGLVPAEQQALAFADGLRTLDEVVAASPLDALSTRQLLAALVLVGALTVKVVQAGRPAAQVSTGIDLARVKEKLEQVRRADYFTVLGLGRLATPHEVRAAAERLTAEFQAERFRGHEEEGLPARLEEIRRVLADAREVLADPFLREEYERGLSA